MTARQVNKIYGSLSPTQLATLTYESCIEVNIEENDRLLSVANRADANFTRKYIKRLNVVSNLINTWAVEYWQTTAAILAYEHLMISGGLQNSDSHRSTDLHHKITALSAALIAICSETGINIEKVLSSLSISSLAFKEQQKTKDEVLNNKYIEMYLNALSI